MGEAKRRKERLRRLGLVLPTVQVRRPDGGPLSKADAHRIAVAYEERLTAVHESGHAVGAFLMAPGMGHKPSEAVAEVKLDARCVFEDGSISDNEHGGTCKADIMPRDLRAVFNRVVSEGKAITVPTVDVERWVLAEMFHYLAGPYAEAKLCDLPFDQVLKGNSGKDDLLRILNESRPLGWPDDETRKRIDETASKVREKLDTPAIWAGLLAIADALIERRTLTGADAYSIYAAAFARDPGLETASRQEPA